MVKSTDQLQLPDVKAAQCMAIAGTGPYQGKKKKMSPSLMLVIRPANPGETLEEFQKAAFRDRSFEPSPAACPVEHCLVAKSVKLGAYEKEGDDIVEIAVFERDMPRYPGLSLEEPFMVQPGKSKEIQYFRPDERITRFAGKLYYAAIMESSTSVLEHAQEDYAAFLKTFVVE